MSFYLKFDIRFHTEILTKVNKFGFIIVDRHGALFGIKEDNKREILHRITIDLPNKHARGFRTTYSFARFRLQKRYNYLKEVSKIAEQIFITSDRVNVNSIVLAGSDLKNELFNTDIFDPRLKAVVVSMIDTIYGGKNGFNDAIEQSTVLQDTIFIREKKLLSNFFTEIAYGSGKYCFGVEETMKALALIAIETLIIWEKLRYNKSHSTKFSEHISKNSVPYKRTIK